MGIGRYLWNGRKEEGRRDGFPGRAARLGWIVLLLVMAIPARAGTPLPTGGKFSRRTTGTVIRVHLDVRVLEATDAPDPISPANQDGVADANTLHLVVAAGPLELPSNVRTTSGDNPLDLINEYRTNRHASIRLRHAILSPGGGEEVRVLRAEKEYTLPLDIVYLPVDGGRKAPFARLELDVTWDGKDEGGAFVADGVYPYRATAELYTFTGELQGNGTKTIITPPGDFVVGRSDPAAGTITVDNTPPRISISVPPCSRETAPGITIEDVSPWTATYRLDGADYVPGTTVATEGRHCLRVEATDAVGNHAAAEECFIVDRTPPVLAASGLPEDGFTNGSVSPAVDVVDDNLVQDSVSITLDGQPFASGTTVEEEGEHVLAASATDCAGNSTSRSWTFVIDRTPPAVTIDVPACTGAASVQPAVTVEELHPAGCERLLDGQPWDESPVTAEGDHHLVVRCRDRAGNEGEASADFVIDRTRPVIGATGVEEGRWYGTPPAPEITCEDAHLADDGCRCTLDGDEYVPGTPVDGEGAHALSCTAVDCAGNRADLSVSFHVDLTSPVVTILSPTPGFSVREAGLDVEGTVVDASPVDVVCRVGDGAAVAAVVEGDTFRCTVTLQPGANTVRAEATDRAGNTGHAEVSGQFVTDLVPPVVRMEGPLKVQPGDMVLVRAVVTDDTGVARVVFTVDGADETEDTVEPYEKVVEVSPVASPGTEIVVHADAWDLAGNRGGADHVMTVVAERDDQPPRVRLFAPLSAAPGSAIRVLAEATDDRQVTEVRFRASDDRLAEQGDREAPYEASWVLPDDPALVGSTLVLTATARDEAGNEGTDRAEVRIVAEQDQKAPVVTLIAPAEVFAGHLLRLAARARDDRGVRSVTFYVDGSPVGTDYVPPYETTFPVPEGTPAGTTLELEVRAVDFAGLEGTDAGETVVLEAPRGELAVVTGDVYDCRSGKPVQGARVRIVARDDLGGSPGEPAERETDARGRYRLPVDPGGLVLEISREGWTRAVRRVQAVGGHATLALDACIVPRDTTGADILSAIGGEVSAATGDAGAKVPAGALAVDGRVSVTRLDPQGVPAPLPPGWSVVAGAVLEARGDDGGTIGFGSPVVLWWSGGTIKDVGTRGLPLVLARYDFDRRFWLAVEGVPYYDEATGRIAAEAGSVGVYALAVPDAVPLYEPPPAIPGEPLEGSVEFQTPGDATLVLDPSPGVLFASTKERARVTLSAVPADAPLPSGTRGVVEIDESYRLTEEHRLYLPPHERDVVLSRVPDGPAELGLAGGIVVSPSRDYAPFEFERGRIALLAHLVDPLSPPVTPAIGSDGGEVASKGGARLTVPAGTVAEPTPVRLLDVPRDGFPDLYPPDMAWLGGVCLDLRGGAVTGRLALAMPAPPQKRHGSTFSPGLQAVLAGTGAAATPDNPVDPVRRRRAILAEASRTFVAGVVEADGRSVPVLASLAEVQGDLLVMVTDPLGDGSLVLPGVRREGWFAFLESPRPFGFVTGTVTAPDGTPVAGTVVTTDSFPLGAITDEQGRFVLLAPVGPFTVTVLDPATRDLGSASGEVPEAGAEVAVEVGLEAVPPRVLAIAPEDGATDVPLSAGITVRFSEPVLESSFEDGDGDGYPDGILLETSGVPVAGMVVLSLDGTTATFRSTGGLLSDADYVVRVTRSVLDRSGYPLAEEVTTGFHTEDRTPPPRPEPGQVTVPIPPADGGTIHVTGGPGTACSTCAVAVENVTSGITTSFEVRPDGSFEGDVEAHRADRLQLVIVDEAGNRTVMPLTFRDPDGAVVIGSAGGVLTLPGEGLEVRVPPGAVPDGTVMRLAAVDPGELPFPVPDEYDHLVSARLEVRDGVEVTTPLEVRVEAPGDAIPEDEVLAIAPVKVPSRQGWSILDRLVLAPGENAFVTDSDLTTSGADGRQPPVPFFRGVRGERDGLFSVVRYRWPAEGRPGSKDAQCRGWTYAPVFFETEVYVAVLDTPWLFLVPPSLMQAVTVPGPCEKVYVIEARAVDTDELVESISSQASPRPDDAYWDGRVFSDDKVPPKLLDKEVALGGSAKLWNQLVLHFSEPMDELSLINGLEVTRIREEDDRRFDIDGDLEPREHGKTVIFRPYAPFVLDALYEVHLLHVTDMAGNELPETTFTFHTLSLQREGSIVRELEKKEGHRTVADIAVSGNLAFVANGATKDRLDDYTDYWSHRNEILAVSMVNPADPEIVATLDTPTNPLALDIVRNYQGRDYLVVAGGGYGSLETFAKLYVYDVTPCFDPRPFAGKCLETTSDGRPALVAERYLASPRTIDASLVPPGVPLDPGIPKKVRVFHGEGPDESELLLAYVQLTPLGLETIDLARAIAEGMDGEKRGPEGIRRDGGLKDFVVLGRHLFQVRMMGDEVERLNLTADMAGRIPLPETGRMPPTYLLPIENTVRDIDGDGRLGKYEDEDEDDCHGIDEIFNVLVVSRAVEDTDFCIDTIGEETCGSLFFIDVSSWTDLPHTFPEVVPKTPRIVGRVVIPGGLGPMQYKAESDVLYVLNNRVGKNAVVRLVDVSFLERTLAGINEEGHGDCLASCQGRLDRDGDGTDDRILGTIDLEEGYFDYAWPAFGMGGEGGSLLTGLRDGGLIGAQTGPGMIWLPTHEVLVDMSEDILGSKGDAKVDAEIKVLQDAAKQLLPYDYYPDLGRRQLTLKLSGRPVVAGDRLEVRARLWHAGTVGWKDSSCASLSREADTGTSAPVTPSSIVLGNGQTRVKLHMNAAAAAGAKIGVCFTWKTESGKEVARLHTLWTVVTNEMTRLGSVLAGKRVYVKENTSGLMKRFHQMMGGSLSWEVHDGELRPRPVNANNDEYGALGAYNGCWSLSLKGLDFVQFLWNQVHLRMWTGSKEVTPLVEDGIYGPATKKAVEDFWDVFKVGEAVWPNNGQPKAGGAERRSPITVVLAREYPDYKGEDAAGTAIGIGAVLDRYVLLGRNDVVAAFEEELREGPRAIEDVYEDGARVPVGISLIDIICTPRMFLAEEDLWREACFGQGKACKEVHRAGLFDLYELVVRPFVDAMLERAYEYADVRWVLEKRGVARDSWWYEDPWQRRRRVEGNGQGGVGYSLGAKLETPSTFVRDVSRWNLRLPSSTCEKGKSSGTANRVEKACLARNCSQYGFYSANGYWGVKVTVPQGSTWDADHGAIAGLQGSSRPSWNSTSWCAEVSGDQRPPSYRNGCARLNGRSHRYENCLEPNAKLFNKRQRYFAGIDCSGLVSQAVAKALDTAIGGEGNATISDVVGLWIDRETFDVGAIHWYSEGGAIRVCPVDYRDTPGEGCAGGVGRGAVGLRYRGSVVQLPNNKAPSSRVVHRGDVLATKKHDAILVEDAYQGYVGNTFIVQAHGSANAQYMAHKNKDGREESLVELTCDLLGEGGADEQVPQCSLVVKTKVDKKGRRRRLVPADDEKPGYRVVITPRETWEGTPRVRRILLWAR